MDDPDGVAAGVGMTINEDPIALVVDQRQAGADGSTRMPWTAALPPIGYLPQRLVHDPHFCGSIHATAPW
jgi:hypothetical protein